MTPLQPPAAVIRADLAAAPNVVARKSSAICGLGIVCKHLAATVRFGETGADAADWWANGECGEVLVTILDGISAGEFVRENDSTWTRVASEGWVLSISGQPFTPALIQTLTMDGDRPASITLRAEGAELAGAHIRSIQWTVEYIRASVADRALDLPARSVLAVEYLNDHRVTVRSRFDQYRSFKTSSALSFAPGFKK